MVCAFFVTFSKPHALPKAGTIVLVYKKKPCKKKKVQVQWKTVRLKIKIAKLQSHCRKLFQMPMQPEMVLWVVAMNLLLNQMRKIRTEVTNA